MTGKLEIRKFRRRVLPCTAGPKPYSGDATIGAGHFAFVAVSGGEDAISTHCSKTEAGRRVRARTTVPERKSCEGLEKQKVPHGPCVTPAN